MPVIQNILPAAFLAAGLGGLFIWNLIRIAERKCWYETNDERKVHCEKISALGGVGMFPALWLSVFMVSPADFQTVVCLLASALLFFTSVWDDRRPLPALFRLAVQALAAAAVFLAGLHFPILEAYPLINFCFTVGSLLILINAFNLIDGINGLAGGLGLTGALLATILQTKAGTDMPVAAALTGVLLGFLFFNFRNRARIFMGDSGSTLIGFLLGVVGLQLLGDQQAPYPAAGMPTALAGVVILPVMDLFRVALSRMRRGRSPFAADRNHIHHLLVDGGWKPINASLFLMSWQLFLLALGWLAGPLILLPAAPLIYLWIDLLRRRNTAVKGLPAFLLVGEKPR